MDADCIGFVCPRFRSTHNLIRVSSASPVAAAFGAAAAAASGCRCGHFIVASVASLRLHPTDVRPPDVTGVGVDTITDRVFRSGGCRSQMVSNNIECRKIRTPCCWWSQGQSLCFSSVHAAAPEEPGMQLVRARVDPAVAFEAFGRYELIDIYIYFTGL